MGAPVAGVTAGREGERVGIVEGVCVGRVGARVGLREGGGAVGRVVGGSEGARVGGPCCGGWG